MEGPDGIGKLLSLQASDPSNASLYEEMIWLLSSPNQEVGMEQETTPMVNRGDRRTKKNKRRAAEVEVTTTLEEEDEEMVVVKPEFDIETYGDDFDDNISSSKRKRRKLSNDPVAGMITPPSTPPERKAPPVNHPTPLSEVPDDGKPWYDGCEYQCKFCPLATKHITQVWIRH